MGDWTDLLPRLGQSNGLAEFAQNLVNSRSANAQNDAQTQLIQAQTQAAAVKATRAQQYNQRVAAITSEMDPKKQTQLISQALLDFPEQKDAIKAGWDVKDSAAKTADLGQLSDIVGAIDSGKVDLAVANMDRRIAADTAAGIDASIDQQWRDALASGDPKAIAYVRAGALGHIGAVDPERFAQNYTTAAKPGSPFDLTPGATRFASDGTMLARAPTAQKQIQVPVYDTNGKRIGTRLGVLDEQGNFIEGAGGGAAPSAAPAGPVTVATLKPLFSAQESGGSYTARNPDTGAMGRWQVMPGTGAKLAKSLGIEWRPDMMLHDTAADRAYQDKIGEAAIAEAVAKAGGDPAKAFSYYYSGKTNAYLNPKGNPKTAKYVSDMMTRLSGGDPRAKGGVAPQAAGGGNYIGPVAAAPSSEAMLDDDTAAVMADQYLAGDPSVLTNLGRGAQGAANIVKLRKLIVKRAQEQGLSGAEIAAQMIQFKGDAAAMRTAGVRSANADLAVTEAQKLIPLALSASAAVPRSKFLPFSKAQQYYRNNTNDPTYRQFVAANTSLVNVYARAISPTGVGTVSDKDHAREILDTAFDDASYRAAVAQLNREMAAAKASPGAVRRDIYNQVGGVTRRPSGAAPSSGWGKATRVK